MLPIEQAVLVVKGSWDVLNLLADLLTILHIKVYSFYLLFVVLVLRPLLLLLIYLMRDIVLLDLLLSRLFLVLGLFYDSLIILNDLLIFLIILPDNLVAFLVISLDYAFHMHQIFPVSLNILK